MREAVPAAVLFIDIAGSTALRARVGDAAAGTIMSGILRSLVAIVTGHGGEVLKSDGDDLLVLFRTDAPASSAAEAAVASQREARAQDQALYAGISFGPVQMVEVLGRPDIEGLSVNLAARLHKLVPNDPGHIFIDEQTVRQLYPELQALCRPFGPRHLKGIGEVNVFSMDWDDARTAAATQVAGVGQRAALRVLRLGVGRVQHTFDPEMKSIAIGRSSKCDLLLSAAVVSSRHVELSWEGDTWSVRDLSRNGTWARFQGSSADLQLQGRVVPLPTRGSLCLGQRFEDDAQGTTTVEFEQTARPC
ncbi:MAG: FHA domain-containing protein [Panacagrimonas sp.]